MSRILCPAVLVPFVVPFVVLLALLSPNSSLGATWLVNPEGTGDFPTIQIAISQSSDGDVIELTDGVFTGIGNRDILFVGKQVTVRSQSGRPEDCILDCEGSLTERHGGFAFLAGEGPLSVIEGFTIRRAWSPGNPETSGAAVRMESGSSPTIRNCVFSDCRSPHGRGGAIYAADGSTPLIEDCSFYRNSSNYDGGAIAFWISSPGIVRRCYFEENESLRGGAASIVFSSPSFESCTFVGNSTQYDGAVLFAEYYSVPVLDRCTLFANESRLVGGAISS